MWRPTSLSAAGTFRLQYRGTSSGPEQPRRAAHTAGMQLIAGMAESVCPPRPKFISTVKLGSPSISTR